MTLDDPKWKTMRGGYRSVYDPTGALRSIQEGANADAAWDELWENLHHQGDVGEASYACIPYLVSIHEQRDRVSWNVFAIACTIELARLRGRNPSVPLWLAESYTQAWQVLQDLALRHLPQTHDATAIRSMLGAIAIAKNAVRHGAILIEFTDDELDEILMEYHGRS